MAFFRVHEWASQLYTEASNKRQQAAQSCRWQSYVGFLEKVICIVQDCSKTCALDRHRRCNEQIRYANNDDYGNLHSKLQSILQRIPSIADTTEDTTEECAKFKIALNDVRPKFIIESYLKMK